MTEGDQRDRGLQFLIAQTREDAESVEKRTQLLLQLDRIQRFSGEPMVHRTTVLAHTSRVSTLTMMENSYLYQAKSIRLDGTKIGRFPHYHDFPEIVTGDIPSPDKEAMSEEETEELARREEEAIRAIAHFLMPEFEDVFVEDLHEIRAKRTPEAQLVGIADKWDALGEVITDIRCGNDTPEIDKVYERYLKKFEKLQEYPMMQLLQDNPQFGLAQIPSLEEVRSLSKIDLNLLKEDTSGKLFWQRVFDPTLPPVYRYWLSWCSSSNSHDLGILTSWRNILCDYPLPTEDRFNIIASAMPGRIASPIPDTNQ